MPRSSILKQWGDDYAEVSGGLNPRDLTWRKSNEWDRANANKKELQAREPDVDRVWQAFDLAEAESFSDALDVWRELADLGSVWSMLEIARCYEHGRGVPRNSDEAERWYKHALAGGSQIAMLECAKMQALRQDFDACEAILKIGVEQDWTPAIFWSAWYSYKSSDRSERYRAIYPLLKIAAKRGHPAADMILTNFMVRAKLGLFRVPIGLVRAIRLAMKQVAWASET